MKTRKAYCGGTFDLLHPGHVRFFRWVHDNFDYLIVGLNTDDFVEKYKGKPPAQPYAEREEMLRACRWVNDVVPNIGGADSRPAIDNVRGVTHIVNGSDWDRQRLMQQMGLTEHYLELRNIRIALCPLERLFSTTELKERIRRP